MSLKNLGLFKEELKYINQLKYIIVKEFFVFGSLVKKEKFCIKRFLGQRRGQVVVKVDFGQIGKIFDCYNKERKSFDFMFK